MPPTPSDNGWHLDKKVPISIIVAMLAQFAGGLWFISKLDSRVGALEDRIASQRERDNLQDQQSASSLSLLRGQLDRMDAKLDRLVERQQPQGGKR
jgi:Tfp pilus assembly protein PilO